MDTIFPPPIPALLSATTTYPIHIAGLGPDARAELLFLLTRSDIRQTHSRIAELIKTPGFAWLELDSYIAQFRPVYLAALSARRRKADQPELENGLSSSDGARIAAARKVPMRPYCDLIELADLLDGQPGDILVPMLLDLTHSAGQAGYRHRQDMMHFESAVKIWMIRDSYSCPHCRSLNNKKFPLPDAPWPPHHIGCRCSTMTG